MDSTNTVEPIIGERLRARRAELGLTQAQLGAAVGLSYQQIQKYENGSNQIAIGRLLLLAVALNVPVMHFLAGLPGADISDDTAEASLGRIRHRPTRHAIAALMRTVIDRQG